MKTRRIFAMIALLMVVLTISVRADEALVPIHPQTGLPLVEDTPQSDEPSLPTVEEIPEKEDTEAYVPPVEKGNGNTESSNDLIPPLNSGDKQEQDSENWIDGAIVQVETWTEWLLEQIVLYRNDITSTAGVLAFIVYSVLYKKKLVPSVDGLKTKVTSTMATVIENVQDYIEAFSQKLTVQQKTWTDDINAIAEVVKKYESIMQETQKQQTEVLALQQQLAASDARNHVYGQIMRAQVEMVHQSLSSACLLDEQHTANHKAYLKQKEMLDKLDEELIRKTGAVSEVLAQDVEAQTDAGGDAV